MAWSKSEWESGQRVEVIEQAFSRSRILYIRTEILIHDYAPEVADALERYNAGEHDLTCPPAAACSCCGSRTATIVERRRDVELLIDRVTGVRVRREDMPAEAFDQVRAQAEEFYIPLRVARDQLDLLLAPDARGLFASGGNRSGKTTVGLYWLARQWLLRGGPLKRFWLVGHTVPKAFRLWEKLFKGSSTSPAILPLALVVRAPDSHRSTNLQTIMVDGSIIDLQHFTDPGAENLKSDPIVAALCDEAAHLPSEDCYTALYNRTLDERGAIFLASTPRPSHFLKTKLVDPCKAYARLEPGDPARVDHEGRLWAFRELSLFTNPWLDPIEVKIRVAALGEEDPSVLRDVFGRWIANSGPLWRDFSTDRHVIRNEYRGLAEWQEWAKADITPTVARRLFGRDNPHYRGLRASSLGYIGGMDVNRHPMSTVVLQVACDPSDPTNRDKWTVFVWDLIYTEHGNALKQADALSSHAFARVRRADAAGSELKGIGIITDGTAVTRDPTAHSYGGDPRGLAELFGKSGFDVRPPEYSHNNRPANPAKADSYRLVHRLLREGRLYIHERCKPLITALLEQEDSGDGTTPIKVSHNRSDRLSSPVDALRYAVWSIFHRADKAATLVGGGGMFAAAA